MILIIVIIINTATRGFAYIVVGYLNIIVSKYGLITPMISTLVGILKLVMVMIIVTHMSGMWAYSAYNGIVKGIALLII